MRDFIVGFGNVVGRFANVLVTRSITDNIDYGVRVATTQTPEATINAN